MERIDNRRIDGENSKSENLDEINRIEGWMERADNRKNSWRKFKFGS